MDTDVRAPILATQMKAFIDAKIKKTSCPICGQDDWDVHAEEVDGQVVMAMGRQMAVTGDRFYPTYSMNCKNCSYIHLFFADLVHEWVAKHG